MKQQGTIAILKPLIGLHLTLAFSCRFWLDFTDDFFRADAEAGPSLGKKRTKINALLWGAHQRFFLQMCLAVKYICLLHIFFPVIFQPLVSLMKGRELCETCIGSS